MDLDELRAFVAIADRGSLLDASRALSVSRTTLRRRIDTLSARLGVILHQPSPTGIELTEAGLTLAEHGRRLIRESESIAAAVQEIASGPSGELRVVVPVGMPPHAAIPLYAGLRGRFPGLSLRTRMAEDPLAASQGADLILHFGQRPAHGGFITRRLVALRVWLVASHAYLERHGTPTRVEDLADHPLLLWTGLDSPGTLPLLDGRHVPVRPAVTSRDIHMLRQIAIAGHGIALLPDGMFPDPGFAKPPLSPVLERVVGAEVALWTAIPEALRNAPRVRAMLAGLMDVVEPSPETATASASPNVKNVKTPQTKV